MIRRANEIIIGNKGLVAGGSGSGAYSSVVAADGLALVEFDLYSNLDVELNNEPVVAMVLKTPEDSIYVNNSTPWDIYIKAENIAGSVRVEI